MIDLAADSTTGCIVCTGRAIDLRDGVCADCRNAGVDLINRLTAERDALQGQVAALTADSGAGWRYAHMCRDGHVEIGHNDSEGEMCPVCVLAADNAKLRERLAAAEELLKCLEWVDALDTPRFCGICRRQRKDGHAADCGVNMFFTDTETTNG